jgi:hypothetical protein
MNKKTRKLAKKAGFIFWKNEKWKPPGEVIDWSCMYDEELEKFAELVRADERKKCLSINQPDPPPECKTEEEKLAFVFGWWKAMEKKDD